MAPLSRSTRWAVPLNWPALAERAVHQGEQNDRQGKAEGEPARVNDEALEFQYGYVPWA